MNSVAAIMQPYFFPYLGYFQLIQASSTFVFFDDVNFIKKGWVNRNNILNQGESLLITIPVKKTSQNRLINETECIIDERWIGTFFKRLKHCYSSAPYYENVIALIETIDFERESTIDELAISSVTAVYDYLQIDFQFLKSSKLPSSEHTGSQRIIEITKQLNCQCYVNLPGGKRLYQREMFTENNLELHFIHSEAVEYPQFNNSFVANLSIIDVLMFNSVEQTTALLNSYSLN